MYNQIGDTSGILSSFVSHSDIIKQGTSVWGKNVYMKAVKHHIEQITRTECYVLNDEIDFISVIEGLKNNGKELPNIKCVIGYQLSDDELKILSECLKDNDTLVDLSLNNIKLNSNAGEMLIDSLKKNKTLKTLSISYSRIGNHGAKNIAKMLEKNKTITTLRLDNNDIGVYGTYTISESLKHNKVLDTIDLSYNSIGDQGAKLFAKMLEKNKTIESLKINNNNIYDTGAKELAKALLVNKTLKSFDMWGYLIDQENENSNELSEDVFYFFLDAYQTHKSQM